MSDLTTLGKIIGSYSTLLLFLQHGKKFWTKILPQNVASFIVDLSLADLLRLNSRIVSSVNAILMAGGGSYVLIKDKKFQSDLCLHHSKDSQKFLLLFLGYVIYDFLLISIHRKQFKDVGIFFHHFVFIILVSMGGIFKLFHGTGLIFCLNEISTPFLNLRYFLNLYSKQATGDVIGRISKCNDFLFFITFLFARVVLNTVVSCSLVNRCFLSDHEQYSTIDKGQKNLLRVMTFVLISLTGLNYYWFIIITRNALSTLH